MCALTVGPDERAAAETYRSVRVLSSNTRLPARLEDPDDPARMRARPQDVLLRGDQKTGAGPAERVLAEAADCSLRPVEIGDVQPSAVGQERERAAVPDEPAHNAVPLPTGTPEHTIPVVEREAPRVAIRPSYFHPAQYGPAERTPRPSIANVPQAVRTRSFDRSPVGPAGSTTSPHFPR